MIRKIQCCFTLVLLLGTSAAAFAPPPPSSSLSASCSRSTARALLIRNGSKDSSSSSSNEKKAKASKSAAVIQEIDWKNELQVFENFRTFLQATQKDIISQLETMDGSGETFTKDAWGIFEKSQLEANGGKLPKVGAGGITRVLQGGDVIEKGACSLTVIQNGVLSPERARAIRARQPKDDEDDDDEEDDDDFVIGSGDFYSAAALSIVLHSKSPMVPTFRSDVRIFLVQDASSKNKKRPVMAFFGGGADLTPYYLNEEDTKFFHQKYKEVCEAHGQDYKEMKETCDDYFYLPARSEHR